MRIFIASVCFLFISASCNSNRPHSAENSFQVSLALEEGERWWVGVITDSHLFPLNEGSVYTFDFYGDTKGNQGQPLLISNKGRYICHSVSGSKMGNSQPNVSGLSSNQGRRVLH